jgi:RHS repeat-associated protein
VKTAAGALWGYIYDGEGNRVAKGSLASWPTACPAQSAITATTQYVIGLGGEQLTEITGSGTAWGHTNVFAEGGLLATYTNSTSGSDTVFALTDWQGTKRAESGASSCLTGWSSLPYGDSGANPGPTTVSIDSAVECMVDATEHHYTGKLHDSETGNDDFGARYYASTAARWLSPDWASGAEAVPYASYGSPQTLNLYAFVGNNPLSHVDPDGHQDYRVSCTDGVAGQCGEGTNPDASGIYNTDGMGPQAGDNNWNQPELDREAAAEASGGQPNVDSLLDPTAQQNMSVSQEGQDFIKGYEKLRLNTYDANPPHGDWTVGYGHKVASADFGSISKDQAEKFFSQDVSNMAAHVNADLKVSVTQNQFDALVSLRFNAGANAVTPPVSDLNRTGHATMGDFTNHYITAGGVFKRGLENRRAAEWRIFSQGVYDATH